MTTGPERQSYTHSCIKFYNKHELAVVWSVLHEAWVPRPMRSGALAAGQERHTGMLLPPEDWQAEPKKDRNQADEADYRQRRSGAR